MIPKEAATDDVLWWSVAGVAVLVVAFIGYCAWHFPKNDHEDEADEGFTGGSQH